MFYSTELLRKSGPYGLFWLAVTCPSEIKASDLKTFNFKMACKCLLENILQGHAEGHEFPPLSPHLVSQLILGAHILLKILVKKFLSRCFMIQLSFTIRKIPDDKSIVLRTKPKVNQLEPRLKAEAYFGEFVCHVTAPPASISDVSPFFSVSPLREGGILLTAAEITLSENVPIHPLEEENGDFGRPVDEMVDQLLLDIEVQPEAVELLQVPELREAVEVPQAPELHEAVEGPQAPELHEAVEVPQAPELHEVVEVPQAPELHEAVEVPQAPELHEAPTLRELPEASQPPESPELSSDIQRETSPEITVVKRAVPRHQSSPVVDRQVNGSVEESSGPLSLQEYHPVPDAPPIRRRRGRDIFDLNTQIPADEIRQQILTFPEPTVSRAVVVPPPTLNELFTLPARRDSRRSSVLLQLFQRHCVVRGVEEAIAIDHRVIESPSDILRREMSTLSLPAFGLPADGDTPAELEREEYASLPISTSVQADLRPDGLPVATEPTETSEVAAEMMETIGDIRQSLVEVSMPEGSAISVSGLHEVALDDDTILGSVSKLSIEAPDTVVTFSMLVPPGSCTRFSAAVVFRTLLGLHERRRVVLNQRESYSEIEIHLIDSVNAA